jgi:hypothetical protein
MSVCLAMFDATRNHANEAFAFLGTL